MPYPQWPLYHQQVCFFVGLQLCLVAMLYRSCQIIQSLQFDSILPEKGSGSLVGVAILFQRYHADYANVIKPRNKTQQHQTKHELLL